MEAIGKLVPVERKQGVTIYGRVINTNGKLGQYEVHSDWVRYDGITYNDYPSAENKMNALIGVQQGKAKLN